MKYTFTSQEGKKEEITPERWVWGVVYLDDSEFHQFGKDGVFHQIREIKWNKVKMFTMYKSDDIKRRIDLLVLPNMQVFHFYRNVHAYYFKNFKDTVKAYVFGYKIKGTKHACYNFILPDDRIVISDKNNVDLPKLELHRE